ncbi:MAG: caspase family protein [Neomegalonema sp.]|nr:caspase family protein [Neomegalonema sp.]
MLIFGGYSGEWAGTNFLYFYRDGKIVHRKSFGGALLDFAHATEGGKATMLAAAISNSTADLYEVRLMRPNLKEIYRIKLRSRPVAIDFALDGRFALVTSGGDIQLFPNASFDGATNQPMATASPPGGRTQGLSPSVLQFSPDGRFLAVAYGNNRVIDLLDAYDLNPRARLIVSGVGGVPEIHALTWQRDARGQLSLWAAGGVGDATRSTIVRHWPNIAQPDRFRDVAVARNLITKLTPLPDGGVAFATADPSVGVIEADYSLRFKEEFPGNDMRNLFEGGFAIRPDGSAVSFKQRIGSQRRWQRFDARRLELAQVDPDEDGWIVNEIPKGLANWRNLGSPSFNGRRIDLVSGELARSAHQLSDGRILLGADFSLYLLDKDGRQLLRRPIDAPAYSVLATQDAQRAVVAFGDGTIRWMNIGPQDTLDTIGQLFVAAPDKWVAWLPNGRFAEANGGKELVGYHRNKSGAEEAEWIEFVQLFDRMYGSDQIKARLGLDPDAIERLADAPALDAKALLAQMEVPKVRVTGFCYRPDRKGDEICVDPEKTTRGVRRRDRTVTNTRDFALPEGVDRITLRYDFAMLGEPSEVFVQVNGRAVDYSQTRGVKRRDQPVSAGAQGAAPAQKAETWRSDTRSVRIGKGLNQIQLRIYNEARASGQSAYLSVIGSPPSQAKRVLHVLAIGGNDYKGDFAPLTGAQTDPQRVAALLEEKFDKKHYDQVEVYPLTGSKATRQQVLAGFAAVAATVEPEDGVVIYIAGHGIRERDDRTQIDTFYYVPVDAVSVADLEETGISEADLVDSLAEIQAADKLLVLDTCHSGAFHADHEAAGRMSNKGGIFVFAASQSDQEALDLIDDMGPVATTLVEALGQGLARRANTPRITAALVADYLRDRIPELASERGHRQNAQVINSGSSNFPLVQFTGE